MNAPIAAKKTAHAVGAFAVAVAVLLWAYCALVPPAAMAKITSSTTGSVTVNGVQDGDTVNVYRVVDVTYHDAGNNLTYELAGDYGMSFDEYTELESDSSSMRELADTIASKTIGSATVAGSATASGESATISGLPLGQYLVSVVPKQTGTGKVYQNTIVSLVPDIEDKEYVLNDATVTVKSSPVSVTKTVGDGLTATDEYGVGDTVPFAITATVPSYAKNAPYKTFNVIDTPTKGISLNGDSVVVTAGEETLTAGTHYKTTLGDDGVLKVEFVYDQIANYASQSVTVSLTGVVTGDAVVYTPDTNTARVEFMNNPYDASTVDNDEDDVTVLTYGLYLLKVGGEDGEQKLEGAVFDVYKLDEAGTETIYIDENGTQANAVAVGSFTTAKDGYGKLGGLGAGTYYVIETQAPDGYDVDGLTHKVSVSAVDVDENGAFAGYSNLGMIVDPETEIPPDDTPAPPGEGDTDVDEDDDDDDDPDSPSPRRSNLPKTGDILMGGALIALVVAAGVGIVTVRKRRNEQ